MSSPPLSQVTLPRSHPPTPSDSSSPNGPVENGKGPEADHSSLAFVKGGKRKRLSKACDACHKSKRRCDGTAPCSNCYYASKSCTYTDGAGRPVPAPRNLNPERPVGVPSATVQPANEQPPWADQATLATPPVGRQGGIERDPTTKRSRRGHSAPDSTSPPIGPKGDPLTEGYMRTLDPAVTHELTNIFFAHCNPQRMIIHKPSFSADLALNKVPTYLLLAVCAVAAPLSKSMGSKASHARLAGVPFFQEALSLMFDNSGRLLCEPSVSSAQALCLLEMHEVAASHSWTRQFRYFELALQVLEGSLEVQRPDSPASPSPGDSDSLMLFIDRECTRRCFWLIQIIAWISHIYTHREVQPRMVKLADTVRLPIDETTFELSSLTSSATSEFLRRPAPRTRYASQFGHTLRILEIYHSVETILATKEGAARLAALPPARKALEDWFASLPSHLEFSEENLETQVTMFETSSNSGAWAFCFMHAMYPCCYLAILEGEGTLSEPIPWVRNQLNMIFDAAGTRAKTSILSACALWSYSRYSPDDPQVQVWDREFEKLWGFKVVLVAEQWRKSQAQAKDKERAQAAAAQQQQQQQQQQQMYQLREPKSNSNSPTSTHSSSPGGPSGGGGAEPAPAQPYEGRRDAGNPRALLRTNMNMAGADSESAAHAHVHSQVGAAQTNLPSLKASGLLDSWKPPSEAFANALSLGSQGQMPPPGRASQNQITAAAVPPGSNGLSWLADVSVNGRS